MLWPLARLVLQMQMPPAFQVIANTPGMTPMALNVWLHTPIHRDMPYVRVAADQLDPLVEYVYSLRR